MAQIRLKPGRPGVENPIISSGLSLALATPSTLQALGTNQVYRVDLVWTLNSGP